jgi:hypothetical protein
MAGPPGDGAESGQVFATGSADAVGRLAGDKSCVNSPASQPRPDTPALSWPGSCGVTDRTAGVKCRRSFRRLPELPIHDHPPPGNLDATNRRLPHCRTETSGIARAKKRGHNAFRSGLPFGLAVAGVSRGPRSVPSIPLAETDPASQVSIGSTLKSDGLAVRRKFGPGDREWRGKSALPRLLEEPERLYERWLDR